MHGGNGYIENWPVARQLRDAMCHPIWEGTENIICLDVLRAMAEGARRRGAVRAHRTGARRRRASRARSDGVTGRPRSRRMPDAIAYLQRAPEDLRLMNARRLTAFMADVTQAALLVEEAVWELEHKGSARKAIVAALLRRQKLAEKPLRGITSEDRTPLDHFDAIVRYEPIVP